MSGFLYLLYYFEYSTFTCAIPMFNYPVCIGMFCPRGFLLLIFYAVCYSVLWTLLLCAIGAASYNYYCMLWTTMYIEHCHVVFKVHDSKRHTIH